MPKKLDAEALGRELLRRLASQGPSSAAELTSALGVSQPTFSRWVNRRAEDVLVVGRARATRYAARRSIDGVGRQAPIYEVDERGGARKLAVLHAVQPEGFFVEAAGDDVESGFFADLPYFLHDLRPAGFLGRLVPALHPELEAPSDITLWSAEHTLRYVTRYGWNLIGNLIVGDLAFQRYLERSTAPPQVIRAADRARRYPELAADVMAAGIPGSSAAGEQPKFLAWRGPKQTAVLVKFSPPVRDATSRRIADLLVAEHLALEVVRRSGRHAASSQLLIAGQRVFLEVERFDRVAGGGSRGLLSLLPLDAEFVGRLRTWTDSATALHAQARIDADAP